MKRIFPVALFALAALSHAEESAPPADRLRDLDPGMDRKLRTADSSGSTFEPFLAASYVFELGSDAPGQTGAGFSTGVQLYPDSGNDPWGMKWGVNFSYFGTTGSETIAGRRVDESIDAGCLVAEYGHFRKLSRDWEIGATVGAGAGVFFGESDDGASVDSQGNVDMIFQIKPTLTWRPTRNFNAFLSYKFAYMTPFYDTTLIGYRSVNFFQNTVEAGLSWRF